MTYHKKVSVKFTPVKSWQVGAEKLAGWSRKVGRLKLTKLAGWGPPPDSKFIATLGKFLKKRIGLKKS